MTYSGDIRQSPCWPWSMCSIETGCIHCQEMHKWSRAAPPNWKMDIRWHNFPWNICSMVHHLYVSECSYVCWTVLHPRKPRPSLCVIVSLSHSSSYLNNPQGICDPSLQAEEWGWVFSNYIARMLFCYFVCLFVEHHSFTKCDLRTMHQIHEDAHYKDWSPGSIGILASIVLSGSIHDPAEVQEPLAPVSDLVVSWITRGHPGTTFPPQAAGFPLLPTHQGCDAHIVLRYGFQAHPGTTVSFEKCNPIATSPNIPSMHFHRSAAINSLSKDKWAFQSSYVYSLTTYTLYAATTLGIKRIGLKRIYSSYFQEKCGEEKA